MQSKGAECNFSSFFLLLLKSPSSQHSKIKPLAAIKYQQAAVGTIKHACADDVRIDTDKCRRAENVS